MKLRKLRITEMCKEYYCAAKKKPIKGEETKPQTPAINDCGFEVSSGVPNFVVRLFQYTISLTPKLIQMFKVS